MTALPIRACTCRPSIHLLSDRKTYMRTILCPKRKFYLVTHLSLDLNPPVLLQYFAGECSLPHGFEAQQKEMRKSAQFWRGRQAFHCLSDWKGCVISHLKQRLLSSGINSQVLAVLSALSSLACQCLWPKLLSGLSIWDWLLSVLSKYKTKLCQEVYPHPIFPISNTLPYPVEFAYLNLSC